MSYPCNECGLPHDPAFDMDFTDVEDGNVIHWCAGCGPDATKMHEAIVGALQKPGFAEELEREILRVERARS